jgi:hypothetical protein
MLAPPVRHLHEVALAGHWPGGEEALRQGLDSAWLRRVLPDDLTLIARHRAFKQTSERLSREAGRCGRGVANALLGSLWPPCRRGLRQRADALRDQAEEASRSAQGCWLTLSQRDLLGIEPDLLARGPAGSLLGITDAGRAALRDNLWGEPFEAVARPEALPARVEAFLQVRAQALTAGFPPDPRLDLAAALASAYPGGAAALLDLNARAVADGWRHYDRLPILGAALSLGPEPEQIWSALSAALQWLRQAEEFPLGYETRLAALLVAGSPCASLSEAVTGGGEGTGEGGQAARARLVFVLSRLRAEGWSLAPATIPVAVRLAALPLPQAQVVARVRALVTEVTRHGARPGPHADLAAALAAGSNLHPQAVKHADARLHSLTSSYQAFLDRFSALLAALPSPDPSHAVLAAYLALMPGTVAGTLERRAQVDAHLGDAVWPASRAAVVAALLDSTTPGWFAAPRYVWDLCALLDLDDLTSAYTARLRLSPAQTASRVGAAAPSFGPGTASG